MKSRHIALTLALTSLISFGSVHAADAEAGKQKTIVCAACHGADGNSVNPIWPNLAGQHASYVAKQLREFKNGKRVDPTMIGMVAALSEDDMDNIAAYFETQQSKPATFDAALLEKGQDIYRGGITETSVASCMSCHGPEGKGNGPARYPSLKGQHSQYVVTQLKAFKSGSRANDEGKMMRNVANRMSDAEMQAVAAYISGMK